jgi:hypothetical protein
MKTYSQSGNALFLILIAVALFASLSYAVTQSGRGNGDIAAEKAMLDAATAQQCEAMIDHAINRVKLLNGCQTDEVSYELPDGTNTNSDAPADGSCHLFLPQGGDATPCGPYLDVLVGQITEVGDTDTVAVTSSGVYFKCAAWSGSGCYPSFSFDGQSFPMGRGNVCVVKGDGSDDDRLTYSNVAGLTTNALCSSICGGVSSGHLLFDWHGTITHYLEDDGTLAPYGGSCADRYEIFNCNCWN